VSDRPGQIVILNGAPRSGKSSIVRAMQDGSEEVWLNLGVDVHQQMIPERLKPGVGLRPGGERPDIEAILPKLYAALYESIASHSRLGFNVVADFGHHDAHSKPLHILEDCAHRLAGLPVLFVKVFCPLEVIMERRRQIQTGRENVYVSPPEDGSVPPPVLAWQREVHLPDIYDMEVDTSVLTSQACAKAIGERLRDSGRPLIAFQRLADGPA